MTDPETYANPPFRASVERIAERAKASAPDVQVVFGRCQWCRQPTPGVLAGCADPDCPGGRS